MKDILSIIPHRYPFLLVDRLIYLEPGKQAHGIKNVSYNEPFFAGHFPNYPVMPGVLIVEALAQVGAAAILSVPENHNQLAFFAGINELRFRGQVMPGDTISLKVELTRLKTRIGKGYAVAEVDNKVVVEGELMFALQPNPKGNE